MFGVAAPAGLEAIVLAKLEPPAADAAAARAAAWAFCVVPEAMVGGMGGGGGGAGKAGMLGERKLIA